MIYIVGAGRSGTHALARALEGPQTIVDIERLPTFHMSIQCVLYGYKSDIRTLKAQYARRQKYADRMGLSLVVKDHPNLWLYDHLEGQFVAIVRHPFDTIWSSLSHSGARTWIYNAHAYPPNPLSGTVDMDPDAGQVNLLANRWRLHVDRAMKLAQQDNFAIVSYEGLVRGEYTEVFDLPINLSILHDQSVGKGLYMFEAKYAQVINDITGPTWARYIDNASDYAIM